MKKKLFLPILCLLMFAGVIIYEDTVPNPSAGVMRSGGKDTKI